MKYANLERAAQIAAITPNLEKAREMLSDGATVIVQHGMEQVALPKDLNMNVANAVNYELNKLRKEVEQL